MKMETGTIINQYKIISAIGKGGMGEVFLAQDTKLDRKVALKILPPEFAEDKDRMSRFVREAKSASALNHPNIITIYEIGESDGTHFIATEFIDGKTLSDYAEANPLNYKSALEIAIQVASALDEAHAAGIVHRDIKPDNVMIRSNGLAKILDFGIAKLTDRHGDTETRGHGEEDKTLIAASPSQPVSASHKTSPGMIIGTANYMSPEQAKGKVVDARTDIFSFGVVLYEMIAGHLPFEGENALEMIGAILHKEAKPLDANVPTEITKIISKCLRKDRDERYQTIKDVGNDLKDVKQDLEFQDKLERSIIPNQDENKTQILKATTLDEINQTTTNQTVASNSKAKYFAAGFLTLLLAVGGFFGYKSLSPPTKQINSIAVMPFENKNSDADTDYLSDGLAESLIFRLTQIPDLRVSPTSSVMRYKGKETDIAKIANELGVDAVMTGRMTKRGDNLNITVELVDARTNKSLWGEQYERKLSELLTTQREIVTEIVGKLQLKLSGESEQKLAKKYTDNNEAYQLYLKGNYHYAKRTRDDILKGIEYFGQAIALDPNYALAYVQISDSYATMPAYPYMSPKEAFPKAKAAAQKALAIDPSLAEAHTALAYCLTNYDWNWTEAEREFKRALELNPTLSYAHFRYGWNYLSVVGRPDEAISEMKRALELEPLAIITNLNLAHVYTNARENGLALEQAKKTYNLEPNHPTVRWALGTAYIVNGMYTEAITLSEDSLQKDPTNQFSLWVAGNAYAKSDQRREAENIIMKFKDIAKTRYIASYFVATIYAALGDKDKAFAELEKAYQEHDWILSRVKVDPLIDSLRDDARYKDLLKRMGLPE